MKTVIKSNIPQKMKYLFLLLISQLILTGYAYAQEGGAIVLWDGLESQANWTISENGRLSLDKDHRTEGVHSFEIGAAPEISNGPSKNVVLKKDNSNLNIDLTKKIVVDVYNVGPPCEMMLSLHTDQAYESFPKIIKSGLNKNVVFELNASDFLSVSGLEGIADKIMFTLSSKGSDLGSVYLDNIRIQQLGGLESNPQGISPAAIQGVIAENPTTPEVTSDTGGAYSILNGQSPDSDIPTVPEPATLLLFGSGLFGFLFYRKNSLKK